MKMKKKKKYLIIKKLIIFLRFPFPVNHSYLLKEGIRNTVILNNRKKKEKKKDKIKINKLTEAEPRHNILRLFFFNKFPYRLKNTRLSTNKNLNIS